MALLLAAAAAASAGEPAGRFAPWIARPAPSFTLADLQGHTLSLADLRGKPVVIHFGASW